MKEPVFLARAGYWLDERIQRASRTGELAGRSVGLLLVMSIFLVSACSSPFGGSTTPTQSVSPTLAAQSLSNIKWCGKPLMVFRDEGAYTPTPQPTVGATPTGTVVPGATATPAPGPGTATSVTDWATMKANLGFTIYLPAMVQSGACLVSAQATIHDPIFGGSFTIGYLLPDGAPLSFSEAPLKSQDTTFECNGGGTPTPTSSQNQKTPTASPTAQPSQLCSGAKNTTNVVLSGSGTTVQLQQIFDNLQPDIDWIPAS